MAEAATRPECMPHELRKCYFPEATRSTEALHCHREDRSYIITGGLGGFGLALAVWLANQGAKNLVMTSKRGMRTGGQRKVIDLLRSRGVNVRPFVRNPACMQPHDNLLPSAVSFAPVAVCLLA